MTLFWKFRLKIAGFLLIWQKSPALFILACSTCLPNFIILGQTIDFHEFLKISRGRCGAILQASSNKQQADKEFLQFQYGPCTVSAWAGNKPQQIVERAAVWTLTLLTLVLLALTLWQQTFAASKHSFSCLSRLKNVSEEYSYCQTSEWSYTDEQP